MTLTLGPLIFLLHDIPYNNFLFSTFITFLPGINSGMAWVESRGSSLGGLSLGGFSKCRSTFNDNTAIKVFPGEHLLISNPEQD